MELKKHELTTPDEVVIQKIYYIRGQKVMMDGISLNFMEQKLRF